MTAIPTLSPLEQQREYLQEVAVLIGQTKTRTVTVEPRMSWFRLEVRYGRTRVTVKPEGTAWEVTTTRDADLTFERSVIWEYEGDPATLASVIKKSLTPTPGMRK